MQKSRLVRTLFCRKSFNRNSQFCTSLAVSLFLSKDLRRLQGFFIWCQMQPKELFGKKFIRLTVLQKFKIIKSHIYLWCQCRCKTKKWIRMEHLIKHKIKSCGCLKYDTKSTLTHGMTKSSEYKIWAGMKRRCNNPHEKSYHRYGGRGIKVCQRWSAFEPFYADMGKRPSDKLQIERKNNNIGYTCGKCFECKENAWPSNCCWTDVVEQALNKSNNRFVAYKDRIQTLKEWSIELGISYSTLQTRLKCWSIDKAFSEPLKKRGRAKIIRVGQIELPLNLWLINRKISRTSYYRKTSKGLKPEQIFLDA